MKGKWFLTGILVTALLALAVGLGRAQEPEPPGEGISPQGDVSVAATVSSKISYQGVLKENGQPVNGNRDMTFALYSDNACTTQLGSEINVTVSVTSGVFSVELNFGPTFFDGRPVWLGIKIGTTQIGCQEILPVPYAMGLRPEAQIVGERSGGHIFYVKNNSTSSLAHGIYGETKSHWMGAGVFGFADATTEYSYGVAGRNNSTTGTGVSGYASASTGSTVGVKGVSDSTSGTGVAGYAFADTGTTFGVYGSVRSPHGYGGYFSNSNGVALKAGGSGIIQSTAVSRIFIPGTEAVRHADSRNDLELEYYGRGTVVVRKVTSGAGTETLLVPVVIPAVLYGQPVRIADMRVFYSVSDSGSYIDETHLYRQKMDGGYYELIADITDRHSTTFTYYHIYCTAAECRLDTEEGIISVALHLHFVDPGHTFTIGGIRLTLEHH